MFRRSAACSCALVVLLASLASAQRQSQTPRQTTQLVNKHTNDNERAVHHQITIQLTKPASNPVT
jgi:hypothetical protein